MADDNQDLNVEATPNEGAEQKDAAQETAGQEEKVLKQSEVNKIVGGAKLEAYEKGKREAIADIEQRRAEAQATQQPVQQPQSEQLTMTRDELRKMIEEEATTRTQQQQAQRVVDQFVGKMKLGMQKHDDFEETVTKLDIPNLPPQIIDWANSMDNTADIMYEVAKNPGKFANLLTLSVTSPRLAYDEFVNLSDSIKKNEEAKEKNSGQQNTPLDQVKHSTTGIDNGAPSSVSDYRKQPWNRG